MTSTDSGPPRHTWSPLTLLLLLLRWLCVPTGTTNRTQMIDSACLVRWINKGRVGSALWQLRVRVGVCVSFSTCSANQSRGQSSSHIISSCYVESTTADTQGSNARSVFFLKHTNTHTRIHTHTHTHLSRGQQPAANCVIVTDDVTELYLQLSQVLFSVSALKVSVLDS